MFNQLHQRIGYACKWMHEDQAQTKKKLEEIQRPFNTRSTTARWLDNQVEADAVRRVREIIVHNIGSIFGQLQFLAPQEPMRRMLRLGSDILPFYTHPKWRKIYEDKTLMRYIELTLDKVGNYARTNDIRISFHPGQFTVLASTTPEIVDRSIEEFEYHVDMLRMMGYGRSFQDAKCNVHISGRLGPEGIIAVLPRLSAEAKNVITIENDEMCWGIESSLELEKHLALVLDIHHHLVRTGEYIQPDDDRVKRVQDSWRGVRPVIHYSYSRDTALPEGFDHTTMPDFNALYVAGHKKQKLRAHSDWYPNNLVNDWALSFLPEFDIMLESKMKNLAREQFINYYNTKELAQ